MAKIVDEPVLLRYDTIDGKQVPVYSAKVETTVTNTKTGIVTRYATAGYQPFVVNYLISKNLDPKTFYYDKMKNLNEGVIAKERDLGPGYRIGHSFFCAEPEEGQSEDDWDEQF